MKRKAAAPIVAELDNPGDWIDEEDWRVTSLIEVTLPGNYRFYRGNYPDYLVLKAVSCYAG